MSKIIKASGGIAYETDSGYESQEDWPPQAGNLALIEILDEIARILTINGDEALARTTLEDAITRTQQALVV
jgi:hypothetical protein